VSQILNENVFKILRTSRITEKAASNNGQYVFRVQDDATKPSIKEAVEKAFNVSVASVRICRTKDKDRRFGKTLGRRRGFKKAYVTLEGGQIIEALQS
jgi:large subunit ribosomal protein L23